MGNFHLINLKSGEKGKVPAADLLHYGELAVNYAEGGETVFLKNSKDAIVEIKPHALVADELSKKQDKTDNALATTSKTVVGAINEVKTTIDGFAESISSKEMKTSKLVLIDNGYGSDVPITADNETLNIAAPWGYMYIRGVASPSQDNDAANKGYVDSQMPDMSLVPKMGQSNNMAGGSIGFGSVFIGDWGSGPFLELASTIEDLNEPNGESICGINIGSAGMRKRRFTGINYVVEAEDATNKDYVDSNFLKSTTAESTYLKKTEAAIKVANALSIAGVSFDGSSAVSIDTIDCGEF